MLKGSCDPPPPPHPTGKWGVPHPQQPPVGSGGGCCISFCARVSVSWAGGGKGEDTKAEVGGLRL